MPTYTTFQSGNAGSGDYLVSRQNLFTAYQGAGTPTPVPSRPYIGNILYPDGTVGVPYAFQGDIAPPEVATPITYSISAGSLPPGLSLSSPDSSREWEISGTPTTAGTYTFTLKAQNGLGFDTVSQTIKIDAAAAENYGFVG